MTTASDAASFDDLWDYEHPAETEARFRDLLPGASGDLRTELLSQIARAQGLQRRFTDAHRTLDGIAAMAIAPRPRVWYLVERGRVLNSSGSPDEARPYFEQAFDLARTAGQDALAVDAAHMIAIVAPREEALEWNRTALDLARQSPEPKARRWQGSLLNNIGWAYFDLGQHEQALQTFEEALTSRLEQGQPREIGIARWCIARTLRALGRIREAMEILHELHEEHERSGEPGGYTYEELGECLLGLGRSEEARPHFARAYAVLSQDNWLQANEPARLERMKALAGIS